MMSSLPLWRLFWTRSSREAQAATRETVEAFAGRFMDVYMPSRNLKRTTEIEYRNTLERHVIPSLGEVELAVLSSRPEPLDRYVLPKTREGLSPKTIGNHLSTVSKMFEVTPKSRAGRRTVGYGPVTAAAFDEQWQASRYRGDTDLVFGHMHLGTPLDPSKLSRYMRAALKRAAIEKSLRPWHDLRHTAITHDAAAGNPQGYIQARAGHSQGSITERYIHAA